MKKALAILAVLVLAGSVANADVVVGSWKVNRDNFNANIGGETLWNCGATTSWRFAKGKQEGTYYGDWSESDLLALQALLATPPTPGNHWEVWLGIAMTSLVSQPKNVIIHTLNSVNDWREGASNKGPGGGACNDWADYDPINNLNVPWVDQGSGLNKLYWGLSDLINSTQMIVTQTGPGLWNEVVLDPALYNDLFANLNNRGLRAEGIWGSGDDNAGCAAIGQWGGGGNGFRLSLHDIPEPASLMLVMLGGVGLVLRRRR